MLAADGSEIVKRRGYLAPEQMASLLAAIIADPSPGPSVRAQAAWVAAKSVALLPAQQQKLRAGLDESYDDKWGGWGKIHKLLDGEAIAYALGGPISDFAGGRVLHQPGRRSG